MRTYTSFFRASKAEARRLATRAGDAAAALALERGNVTAIEAFGKDLELRGLLFQHTTNGVVRTHEWIRVEPTDWWIRRGDQWTGPFGTKGAAVGHANAHNASGPAPVRRIGPGHYRHAVSNDVIRHQVAVEKGWEPRVERDT